MSTDRYDREIQESVERWWPAFPIWRAWKAQLYQESLLEPAAVSPVGAAGIAQFMPGTWADVGRSLGLGWASPHMAGPAIDAGAYYMATLQRFWSSPRPALERQRLAQASYNAGAGNIRKAQIRCNNARDWSVISTCLALVTGRHARETLTYVDRIERWWRELEAMR